MKIKNYLFVIILFTSSFVFSQTGTEIDRTLTMGGNSYPYRIYVPKIYDGSKPVPLLFNIHGFTGSGTQQEGYGDFRKIADTANFIIIHPTAKNNSGNWDVFGTPATGAGDRTALLAMLDTMEARYNINSCKVYSTGFSQGGFMSFDLASNIDNPTTPPRFAAIAPVSGNYVTSHWTAKNPQHPTPVMVTHGTSDGVISYTGVGGLQLATQVDSVVKYWVKYNHCTTPYPTTAITLPNTNTADACTVEHYVYSGGDRGSSVEFYKIIGGGHSWPGASSQSISVGNINQDYSASLVIWQFLSKYCLPYLMSSTCTSIPTISAQPTNSTICSGSSTTFAVTASGCVGTALTYQWQVDTGSGFTNLTNASPYSGVTTNSLAITSATIGLNNYEYRCIVTSCCDIAKSNSGTLTVNNCCTAPTITGTTPASRCDAGTVALAATASAGTINWYDVATGGTSLGTGTSFTTPNISSTTTYYVDATNNGCTTSSRTAVVATVNTTPVINGTTPGVRCGTSIVTLIATASAGTINWYDVAIGGASLGIGTNFTTPFISTTTTYYFDATNNGCTSSRQAITVIINPVPNITNVTPNSRCDAGTVTLGATASAGTINWYAVSSGGSSIGNGTSFTTPSISSTTIYYVDATDNGCTTSSRTSVTATVNPLPTATISGNATVCTGTNGIINIALTGTSPWSFTYGSAAGSNPVTNITSSTYTTSASAGTYTVTAVSDGNNCNGSSAGTATIIENSPIGITNLTTNCSGGSYTVDFDITGGNVTTYTVTGGAGNKTTSTHFQSALITSGTPYSFSVTDAYNCSPAPVSGSKNCGCPATAIISGGGTICNGNPTTISIALAGVAPWQFTYAIDGVSQPAVTNQLTSPYTFTTTTIGAYTLVSVSDANCVGSTNGTASISQTAPTATISGGGTICADGSTNLSFDLTAGSPPWSFTYTDGTTTSALINATATNKLIPVSTAGAYSIVSMSAGSCNGTSSGSANVIVNALPTITTISIPSSAAVCLGGSVTLSGGGATSYVWSGGITDGQTFIPLLNTTYTVIGTDATTNCSNTAIRAVSVLPLPAVGASVSPSATICTGASVALSGTGATTYVWSGSGVNDGVSFIPTASATYTVTGTDGNNCSNTATQLITVTSCGSIVPTTPIITRPAPDTALVSSATTGNQWYYNGVLLAGDTSQTLPLTSTTLNGNYTVIVTVNGVPSLPSSAYPFSNTGIAEIGNDTFFNVYPNPSDGIFNVSFDVTTNANYKLEIKNVLGQTVYQETLNNFNGSYSKQISIAGNGSGVYTISLTNSKNQTIKKIIAY